MSRHRPRLRPRRVLRHLVLPGLLLLVVALWEVLVRLGEYPSYLVPSPQRVWERFLSFYTAGQLTTHLTATLLEVCAGFGLGAAAGLLLGYPVARVLVLERLAVPYIVGFQSVPVVALAPLFIVWFGTGYWSKILVAALITFFPVLINAIVGFRAIERKYVKLMASLNATRRQMFFKIEIPRALPSLFAGFRIAAPLAVVGAVVGEFMGASRGLGYLIRLSQGLLDTPLMFVALIILALIGILFYAVFLALERALLHRVRYF